jgi:hypothetical protein
MLPRSSFDVDQLETVSVGEERNIINHLVEVISWHTFLDKLVTFKSFEEAHLIMVTNLKWS